MAMLLNPPGPYTHRLDRDGSWNDVSIWERDEIPAGRAVVHIPEGKRVTVAGVVDVPHWFIQVDGFLAMDVDVDTRLKVETLIVGPNGTFRIGTRNKRVAAGKTAEIVFIGSGSIDRTWDPGEKSRGFLSRGKVRVFGQRKTHMVGLDRDVAKGASAIDVGTALPSDWQSGDEIVITGSHFRRGTIPQDEKAVISISGTTLFLDRSLEHDHLRARDDMRLHIVNLTRNVTFRSESTRLRDRGHMMFRGPDVRIHHASLISLGRTNKGIPLDEIIVETSPLNISPNPDIQNRRGRYSLHFHLNGGDPSQNPPSEIHGCVVSDTPGWGFVNHSSYVDFRQNICHGFVGAAFVTEAGDELGNFIDNIAIRGTGNEEYRPVRIVFGNLERRHPLSDFGFSGDGFWFQGPAIRARGNVANGCNGAGMIWFTSGAVDISTDRYVGFPPEKIAIAYSDFPDLDPSRLRRWGDPSGDTPVVISDLPILECDGFEAYGCLVGFRLRFNNHSNVAWYKEHPFNYAAHIVPVPGRNNRWADRARQTIRNLKLWNNEMGLGVRYNSETDWHDVTIVSRQDHGHDRPNVGAEIVRHLQGNHFVNLEIDGYEVAGWIEDNKRNARNQVSFDNQSYSNYANFDTWIECLEPSDISVQVVSGSARISWSKDKNADRRMVRYRLIGEAQWQYATVAGPTALEVTLNDLIVNDAYEFQVMAGCSGTISDWTPAGTFDT